MIPTVFCKAANLKLLLPVFGLFFLFAIPSEGSAQNIGDIGIVASGDGELNVRSGPSTQDAITYVLRNGDRVKVQKKFGKWARVSYSTTSSGWVYLPLVNFADDPKDARLRAGQKAFVCNSGSKVTNVRYGPSSQEYDVILPLKNGHEVTVRGKKTNAKGYIYYEVSFTYPGEVKTGAGYIYYKAVQTKCGGKSATTRSASASKPTTPNKPGPFALTNGNCSVIAASRRTAREVLAFYDAMDTWSDNYKETRYAYLSGNGWYAISLGTMPVFEYKNGRRDQMIRNSRWMPNDITCSKRESYIESFSVDALRREANAASSLRMTKPSQPVPSLPKKYDVEVSDDQEARLKEKFETFAKLWTQTYTEKPNESVTREHKTNVSTQVRNPKGMQWCQFKISARRDFVVRGHVVRVEEASYYGNGAAIDEAVDGKSPDDRADQRQDWATYISDSIRLSIASHDGKMNPGYARASCSSTTSKGFSQYRTSSCIEPVFISKIDEEIQKRWRALQSYVLSCGVPVEVARAMKMIAKIQADHIDVLVNANSSAEDKLRPAMEAHKGKTLRLDDMGLTDLAGLSEYPYLEHLYLRKNAISDIGFLSELGKLKTLDLSNNQISDVSVLPELPALTSLNLSNNNINDLSALTSLKAVTALNLRGNPIFDYGPVQQFIDDPDIIVLMD